VLVFDDIGLRVNWNAVDGEEEVAALDAGHGTGRSVGYLDGSDAFGAGIPEDAVLDVMPPGVADDVRGAESSEKDDNGKRKSRPSPHPPAGFNGHRSAGAGSQLSLGSRRKWG
jgi:hypothetical protein